VTCGHVETARVKRNSRCRCRWTPESVITHHSHGNPPSPPRGGLVLIGLIAPCDTRIISQLNSIMQYPFLRFFENLQDLVSVGIPAAFTCDNYSQVVLLRAVPSMRYVQSVPSRCVNLAFLKFPI
jgi:hypothetical protein